MDTFLPDLSSLPDDVLAVMVKSGQMETLTDQDRMVLTRYLTSGNPSPDVAEFVGQALGGAGGTEDLRYDQSATDPTATDWSATPEARAASGNTQAPADSVNFPTGAPMADYTMEQVFQDTPQAPAPPPLYQASSGSSINPNERFGMGGIEMPTDWRFNNPDYQFLPDNSAFADVAPGDLSLYTEDPMLAAMKRNPDNPTAAVRESDYLDHFNWMAEQGMLGQDRGRGLNAGPMSAAARLGLAEQAMTDFESQMGAELDPSAMYRGAFKRTLRTPIQTMDIGQGDAGDNASQIAVTNGTLLQSVGPGVPEVYKQNLAAMLDMLARQWQIESSTGVTDLSYPQYLREKKARRLAG